MSTYINAVIADLRAMLDDPPTTVEGFRDGWSSLMERVISEVPEPAGVRREAANIGEIPAWWFRPPSDLEGAVGRRAIVFLHGGGYAFGSVDTHRDLIARLAIASGVPVLAIDYRLAPEHPYPCGVRDVVTTYRAILDSGFNPGSVAIVGDSAGGGLALKGVQAIRDEGLPAPAAVVTISAWVDFEARGESMQTCADKDPFTNRDTVLAVAEMYLAGGASAAEATVLGQDLSGFPPTLLIAGGDEVLVDDTRRVAAALASAGAVVRERVYEEQYHDFPLFEPLSADGRQALGEIAEFLKERWC